MKQFHFPSSSGPKIYTTMIGDNGLLSCDCPGWTVKKLGKVRQCKHTQKVAADEGLSLEERDGQWFVTSFVGDAAGGTQTTAPTSTKRQETDSEFKAAEKEVPQNPGFVNPMLASAMPEGKTADSFGSGWVLEEKFDGHRLVIRVATETYGNTALNQGIGGQAVTVNKTVSAWSRLGNVRSLPRHIQELMLDMPVGVYDGELIVPSSQHSYSVTAGQSTGQEALVLFDMLETDGTSIMNNEFHVRRAFLEIAYDVFYDHIEFPVRLAEQHQSSMEFVKAVWARGGEGAIIKKLSGKYTPGWRSPDWIKVKAIANATLTIVGFQDGKNGPYSIVKLRDDHGIETTVKTLDNNALRQIAANPDQFIGKRLVISYQERTPSGKYRHPMWDHEAEPHE